MNNYKIETKCIQEGYKPENGEARVLPIYQSTTYKYDSSEHLGKLFDLKADGHMYSRISNPTVSAVEEKIADLEGGVARMGEDLRKPMEEHVHKYAWTPWGHPDVRLAEKPEASVVLGLHKLTLDEIEGKTDL